MVIPKEKMSEIVFHENGIEVKAKVSSTQQFKFYIGEDDIRTILSLYRATWLENEEIDSRTYDDDSIQDAIY